MDLRENIDIGYREFMVDEVFLIIWFGELVFEDRVEMGCFILVVFDVVWDFFGGVLVMKG